MDFPDCGNVCPVSMPSGVWRNTWKVFHYKIETFEVVLSSQSILKDGCRIETWTDLSTLARISIGWCRHSLGRTSSRGSLNGRKLKVAHSKVHAKMEGVVERYSHHDVEVHHVGIVLPGDAVSWTAE